MSVKKGKNKKKYSHCYDFHREYDVPYHVRVAIDLKIFVVSCVNN